MIIISQSASASDADFFVRCSKAAVVLYYYLACERSGIMIIHGFQKMTMLDFPGRVACTVFTAGCNFRCPFCHNASLVTKIDPRERYREEEIFEYLKKRRGILDGVCVTGGEPLLYDDTADFLRKLKALGFAVKLDTNGSFPDRLKKIAGDGLVDYVAMDIKNSREKYALTAGLTGLDLAAVEESVSFLLSGAVDYEFRTTVADELHTEEDFLKIGEWISGAKRYFLQRFVDSGNLVAGNMHEAGKEKMLNMLKNVKKFVPNADLRGI